MTAMGGALEVCNKRSYKEEFKALRKRTGMSQSKFSKTFGIPKRTIESWEMGVSSPRNYNFEYLKEHVERWIDEQSK